MSLATDETGARGALAPGVFAAAIMLNGCVYAPRWQLQIKDPFPFPRPGSTEVTQANFPAIIEAVCQKVIHILGPGSDRPERDGCGQTSATTTTTSASR